MVRYIQHGLILCLLTGLWGCGATRMAAWGKENAKSSFNEKKSAKFAAQGDEAFKNRVESQALKAALMAWEKAVELFPSAETYVKLSRGHYLLADGFHGLMDDIESRDKHFQLGLSFAEKAMNLSAPNVVAAVKEGHNYSDSVKKAQLAAVPALYWYAVNLGKWAASKGFVTRLRYKDRIKATMDQVMALDENYFFAGPWRYFGAYEAATSGIAGGSMDKSYENFLQAVNKNPEYLGTKVLFAEYYAVKKQNKALFEKLLNEVIAAKIDGNSILSPENMIEKLKAKKLLSQLDEKF